MAVAQTAVAQAIGTTVSITPGAGTTVVMALVSGRTGQPTGVTYGGAAMTKLVGASSPDANSQTSLWYYFTTSTTAASVVVTPGTAVETEVTARALSGTGSTSATFGTTFTASANTNSGYCTYTVTAASRDFIIDVHHVFQASAGTLNGISGANTSGELTTGTSSHNTSTWPFLTGGTRSDLTWSHNLSGNAYSTCGVPIKDPTPLSATNIEWAGSSQATTTGTSIAIAVPAETVAGDVLVCFLNNGLPNVFTVTSPGWTTISAGGNTNNSYGVVLTKVATGTEGTTQTFTASIALNYPSLFMSAFRNSSGVLTGTPTFVAMNSQTTPIPEPAYAVSAGDVLIDVIEHGTGLTWRSASPAAIRLAAAPTNQSSAFMQFWVQAAAGTVAARSTTTSTAVNGGTHTFALQQKASGPPFGTNFGIPL